VVNFTKALAGEWGQHGITVNAICPGFFPSKMTYGLLEKMGADRMASQVEELFDGTCHVQSFLKISSKNPCTVAAQQWLS